ncbi:hypothetical protein CTAYLR_008245 [Chrysophaeum taylorii]|uniref:ATP-dependent RNA helicase Ski2/MTR4 C-terminal domain-containing protein n=1 Tax=Chrysophaeum taylorii TaxID=2483200 RepID=A0AAD7XMZ4_9STRA|nr:hypothetical protein CTAYLR_008245 [Chrysophaeum taylorii]
MRFRDDVAERVGRGERVVVVAASREARVTAVAAAAAARGATIVTRGSPHRRAREIEDALASPVVVRVASARRMRGGELLRGDAGPLVMDEDAMLEPAGAECACLARERVALAAFSHGAKSFALRVAAWLGTTVVEEEETPRPVWVLPAAGEAALAASALDEAALARVSSLSRRNLDVARESPADQREADVLRGARELCAPDLVVTVAFGARAECERSARTAVETSTRWRLVASDAEEEARLEAVEALAAQDATLATYLRRGIAIWHEGMLPRAREAAEVAVAEGLVGAVFATPDFFPSTSRLVWCAGAATCPRDRRETLVIPSPGVSPATRIPAACYAALWLRAARSKESEASASRRVEGVVGFEDPPQQTPRDDSRRRLERRICREKLRALRRDPAVCWPWLQAGRLCRLDAKKWVVVSKRPAEPSDEVEVLAEDSWDRRSVVVPVRLLRLTAFRVFMPSDLSRPEARAAVGRSVSAALDDAAASAAAAEKKKRKRPSFMLDDLDVVPPPDSREATVLEARLEALSSSSSGGEDEGLSAEELSRLEARVRAVVAARARGDAVRKRARRGLKALVQLGLIARRDGTLAATPAGVATLGVMAELPNDRRALVVARTVFDLDDDDAGCVAAEIVACAVAARGTGAAAVTAEAARRVYRATVRDPSFLDEDDFVASITDPPLAAATRAWVRGAAFDAALEAARDPTLYEGDFVRAIRAVARVLPVLADGARGLGLEKLAGHLAAAATGLRRGLPFLPSIYAVVAAAAEGPSRRVVVDDPLMDED